MGVYYFLILITIGFANQCQIKDVHITLGDYFTEESSPVAYRVGFMTDKECTEKIQLGVLSDDNEEP